MSPLTRKQYILMLGMMVTGTINTIAKKLQFQCSASGYYNYSTPNNTRTVHHFNKPWLQTLIMFFGETFCIVAYGIHSLHKKRKKDKGYINLIPEEESESRPISSYLLLILPASCDILGTSLAGVGLLFISASMWQMLRGSVIVFTGILSVTILKKRLFLYHWTGMIIVAIGLVLIGSSSILKTASVVAGQSAWHAMLGVIFVLCGAFFTSLQMVVEEVFIRRRNLHPLQIVGLEGFFGSMFMALIILPIMQFVPGDDLNGVYENFLDAMYMLQDSIFLLLTSLLYMLSIAFYNFFGLSVTKSLSAVHRTLIDTLRTVLIWIVNLFIYYVINRDYGEYFDVTFGIIQIDGFVLLFLGTMVYNKILALDFITICSADEEWLLTVDYNTDNLLKQLPDTSYDTFGQSGTINSVDEITNVEPFCAAAIDLAPEGSPVAGSS